MKKLLKRIKAKLHKEIWPLWKIPLQFHSLWSDRSYLEYLYRHKMKKKISLNRDNKDLLLYTEKIQWLKLYDRQPEYTDMADKYNVRKYVAQTIGEEYLIPCYGVWDKFEDIPFDALPDQFVLKCTHDCGSVMFCKDKTSFNIDKARKHFNKFLSRNYYWRSRQWTYKNIKPRIIAEKLIIDKPGVDLPDYKIYCFDGEPKIIGVDLNRFSDRKRNVFNTNWESLPLSINFPSLTELIVPKPKHFELLLELAKKLSAGKIFVRIDMYVVNDNFYFGELTFYPLSGYQKLAPPEWNRTFGDWMTLPI